ncbi:WbqC family protein [Arcobacter arenosus]|uniref:WbqC family protein n=1 Tax=Arcobacter arenosus TaxID=2576037 RepID=A0A5R8Y094_9BACT|nr:WbqC family protein [Arcobacter arenosus]TLP37786.1 WbqC family protein [Arcobacter arenosus]
MIISIHQPHYFLSFAQIKKIIESDKYVFFDDVQMPQGKSVVHRAKIKYENELKWLTITKSKNNKSNLICDINKASNEYIKQHKSIINNYYKNTPTRNWIVNLLEQTEKFETICEVNIFITKEILNYLEFKNIQFFRSSEILKNKTYDNTVNKIIDINKQLNATIYLTGDGPGSMRYMDEREFNKEGIKIKYFSFEHPFYKQSGIDFQKDLSIIDLLCNEGKNNAKNILLSC